MSTTIRPPQKPSGKGASTSRLKGSFVLVGIFLLLGAGLFLSGVFRTHKVPTVAPPSADRTIRSDSESAVKVASGEAPTTTVPTESKPVAPATRPAQTGSAPSPSAESSDAQRAAEALREQELARKQKDLDDIAAQQAAKQEELARAQEQLEARKKQAQAEELAHQQELQKQLAQPKVPAYQGPSSGDIVWQGPVKGSILVTITGGTCDVGHLVSGAVPGIPVIVQPSDAKRIRVATTPAPSNSYQRLVFGVSGNGIVQVVLHWSAS
jgi:hypothetical protein